jgi:hypothetical protein
MGSMFIKIAKLRGLAKKRGGKESDVELRRESAYDIVMIDLSANIE